MPYSKEVILEKIDNFREEQGEKILWQPHVYHAIKALENGANPVDILFAILPHVAEYDNIMMEKRKEMYNKPKQS